MQANLSEIRWTWIKSPMQIAILILMSLLFPASVLAQQTIPRLVTGELQRNFTSWKLADIEESIVHYYAEQRSHEKPNFIRGDWNGDGRTDYAIMLQRRSNSEEKLLLVLLRKGQAFEHHFLSAFDCIMSVKKGSEDYNFETERRFTHRNDAIFSYYWEKAGTSYLWDRGRFRAVLTSD